MTDRQVKDTGDSKLNELNMDDYMATERYQVIMCRLTVGCNQNRVLNHSTPALWSRSYSTL